MNNIALCVCKFATNKPHTWDSVNSATNCSSDLFMSKLIYLNSVLAVTKIFSCDKVAC